MNGLIEMLTRRPRPKQNIGADALATLIIAATEDAGFRRRLIAVLQLPQSQREPLVTTAVDEMRLRGEPADVRAAFMAIATEEGARTALQLLNSASK
jgi:hypothetical protein